MFSSARMMAVVEFIVILCNFQRRRTSSGNSESTPSLSRPVTAELLKIRGGMPSRRLVLQEPATLAQQPG